MEDELRNELVEEAEEYFDERGQNPIDVFVFDQGSRPVGMTAYFRSIEWLNRFNDDGNVIMSESALGAIQHDEYDDVMSLHFQMEVPE